jgi:hypothetical protein
MALHVELFQAISNDQAEAQLPPKSAQPLQDVQSSLWLC